MKKWKYVIVAIVGILFAVIYSFRTWPAEIYDNNIDSTLYTNVGELTEGSKVSQQFTCTQNGLNSLELTMSNLGQECEAEYAWTLTETESEKVVAKGEFTAGEVDNSKNMVLKLSELEESKGKQYVLTIETESIKSEHGVTVMTPPQSERRRKAVDKRERVIAGACDEGTNEIFQYGDIYCIVRIDCLSCVFDHIFKQTF